MSYPLKKKDFESNQEVRWCPGCGDYAILAAIQKTMPEIGVPKEKIVFISGIGCSSRFPYYMNTYGFHTIHGRAPALATGLAISRPDLSIWVITGDGDGLSIGGNHLIHALRRNVNLKVLLFNNQTYGLTKGQYSPTSHVGTKSKSTPYGSVDAPFSPVQVALGAGASFVARTYDKDPKHMIDTFKRAHAHRGSAFIEIFQNCVIFNNDVFEPTIGKEVKNDRVLFLKHGEPLHFGGKASNEKGIAFDGFSPVVTDDPSKAIQHDETAANPGYAFALSQMRNPEFPEPMGVFRDVPRDLYEDQVAAQEQAIVEKLGKGDLDKLLKSGDTWEIH